jgi:fatty-acyl-CoA synthase
MAELMRITVGDLLDEVALKLPENEALVDIPKEVRFSYKEFLAMVNKTAKGFLKLGLKPGDHLALWGPNRWEWIVTQFAVAKIGVVLVSVDINYQIQQLEYLLKQSDSKVLVMTQGLKGSEYVEMIQLLCPEVNQTLLIVLLSQNLDILF